MEQKLVSKTVKKELTKEKTSGNSPEKKFKAGAISSTVWSNLSVNKKGEPIEYKSVTLQRTYLDKNNVWQHTTSLRTSDLPKANLVLNKAYEYIVLATQEGNSPLEDF